MFVRAGFVTNKAVINVGVILVDSKRDNMNGLQIFGNLSRPKDEVSRPPTNV